MPKNTYEQDLLELNASLEKNDFISPGIKLVELGGYSKLSDATHAGIIAGIKRFTEEMRCLLQVHNFIAFDEAIQKARLSEATQGAMKRLREQHWSMFYDGITIALKHGHRKHVKKILDSGSMPEEDKAKLQLLIDKFSDISIEEAIRDTVEPLRQNPSHVPEPTVTSVTLARNTATLFSAPTNTTTPNPTQENANNGTSWFWSLLGYN